MTCHISVVEGFRKGLPFSSSIERAQQHSVPVFVRGLASSSMELYTLS
jgi:hypothetical protein